jgi:hypothetical protein
VPSSPEGIRQLIDIRHCGLSSCEALQPSGQGRSGTGLSNLSESPRDVFHDGISAIASSGLFDGELSLQPLNAGFSAKLAEAERSGLPDE